MSLLSTQAVRGGHVLDRVLTVRDEGAAEQPLGCVMPTRASWPLAVVVARHFRRLAAIAG